MDLEYESLQMELNNGVLHFNLIGKLANDIKNRILEVQKKEDKVIRDLDSIYTDAEAEAERERISRAHARKRGVNDEQLQLVFDVYADGEKTMPKDKLGVVLATVGKYVTKEELKKLQRGISGTTMTVEDVGKILDGEFSSKMEVQVECDSVFEEMDMDGTGKVPADMLRTVLTTMGDKLDEDTVDKLLDELTSGASKVDYKKFISTLLSTNQPSDFLA